jgi:hypothetical protein
MVDFNNAVSECVRRCPLKVGAFYGSADGLSLGTGLVYEQIKYPLYNEEKQLFDTVEGAVLVLTHECDLDPNNERHFTEYVLCCPITPFDQFALEVEESESEAKLYQLIPNIAGNTVFRILYLPPHERSLKYGGIINLNQICSTHVEVFEGIDRLCALSTYALRYVDSKIENHLRRPKAELLPVLD